MRTVYDLSLAERTDTMTSWGEPAFRAKQVHAQLWRRAATLRPDVGDRAVPAQAAGRRAADRCRGLGRTHGRPRRHAQGVAEARRSPRDRGGPDGVPGPRDACVSSQAGCAMGCGFCATGQMGLLNNLTAGEIAAQALWARGEAAQLPDTTPRRLTNIVFMGMGEPMANERHVFRSLDLLTGPAGVGARHLTVSTVGIVPGIERLADRAPQVGLAISFHAATDELRDELVPPNKRYPLARLEAAIAGWRAKTRRRPSIEWAMIAGTNDTDEQAGALAPIAKRLGAHVNLIPLNPTPGSPAEPSSKRRIHGFVRVLQAAGVNVTVRDTRGRRIDAACGQLRLEHLSGSGRDGGAGSDFSDKVSI